jgi:uncharacterized repeat protein (TIGR01451 family)
MEPRPRREAHLRHLSLQYQLVCGQRRCSHGHATLGSHVRVGIRRWGTLDIGAGPNGVVTWSGGSLTAAQSPLDFELVVDIDLSTTGVVTNVAAVTSTTGDPNRANNRAVATTVLGAASDVGVEKTGPASAAPGTEVAYSLRVFNDGPSDATGVALTDTLPPGVSFVSATGGGSFDPVWVRAGSLSGTRFPRWWQEPTQRSPWW